MKNKSAKAQLADLIRHVKAKRPRIVLEHILAHGFITTEELKNKYGYNHPPRAARDVRELGIPLETFRVKSSAGRSIGAYRFGDPSLASKDKLAGRRTFSKAFKKSLIAALGSRCTISREEYDERYLQVEHRIPYDVREDSADVTLRVCDYMLLCGSCNRAKSWSCEHCANRLEAKDVSICQTCYWAHPESYQHVAMQEVRRLEVVWAGKEVGTYDKLAKRAAGAGVEIPEYVKEVLRRHLR